MPGPEDRSIAADVRRIKRGPWQILLGLVIAASVSLLFLALSWPFLMGRPEPRHLPITVRLPTAPPMDAFHVPLPSGYVPLQPWVQGFKAYWRLRTYLPRGAGIVAAQTVPMLYTAHTGFRATGIILQPGIVATAAHLTEHGMSGARVYAVCPKGTVEARVLLNDPVRDIMIVVAPGCDGATLPVSAEPVNPVAPIYLSGFTFGPANGAMASRYARQARTLPYMDREVHCTGCSDPEQGEVQAAPPPMLRAVSGHIIPGHSGSPVSLADGTIVGMGVAYAENGSCSFMIPGSTIVAALKYLGLRP